VSSRLANKSDWRD